jgi:hypothetical protein
MMKKMFEKNKQEQTGGNNSTNIQAGTVIVNGITYEQAHQIALDVFRSNALVLAGEAKDIASARAEQITERFLKELAEKNPAALQSASDPDFQHSVFEAQKAFARSGDENLEDILVNLLSNRAAEPNRNLKQVVLNEAITVSSKLTSSQINTITLLFRVRHTVRQGLLTIQNLSELITSEILPFFEGMPEGEPTYRYLAFTGVATIEMNQINFVQMLKQEYQGVCSNGIDEATMNQFVTEEPRLNGFFIKLSESEPIKFHLLISTPTQLETLLKNKGITSDEFISRVKNLLVSNPMSDEEIKSQLVAFNPKIQELIDIWDKSSAKQTVLTPVGMAIGHANATKHGTLRNAPLEIWVN